jgi:hypothetical protein
MKKLFLIMLICVIIFSLGLNVFAGATWNAVAADDNIRYLLKLELRQSHFSLDLGKHLKDSMNKAKFEIPVDKEFYNSCMVGDLLLDKFREGSFWTEGSIGNWKIKVIGKRTVRK